MTGRRVRLSSFDLMPDAALAAAQWAFDQIAGRRMRQIDVFEEINQRLAALGVDPVSLSGINRWAQQIRNGEVQRPGGRAPAPSAAWPISAGARALLATALRALADDLDGIAK